MFYDVIYPRSSFIRRCALQLLPGDGPPCEIHITMENRKTYVYNFSNLDEWYALKGCHSKGQYYNWRIKNRARRTKKY